MIMKKRKPISILLVVGMIFGGFSSFAAPSVDNMLQGSEVTSEDILNDGLNYDNLSSVEDMLQNTEGTAEDIFNRNSMDDLSLNFSEEIIGSIVNQNLIDDVLENTLIEDLEVEREYFPTSTIETKAFHSKQKMQSLNKTNSTHLYVSDLKAKSENSRFNKFT